MPMVKVSNGGSGLSFKECFVAPAGMATVYDSDWNMIVNYQTSFTTTYFKDNHPNLYAVKPGTYHIFLENNSDLHNPHRVVTVSSASTSSPVLLTDKAGNSVVFAL